MRVGLLTTATPHHAYFASRLSEFVPLTGVMLEEGGAAPPFDSHHPFEQTRDEYEREVLLADRNAAIDGIAPSARAESVNDREAVRQLQDWNVDVLVVFGTRQIARATLDDLGGLFLNLHGGNPEEYRGLDTHLWAIYHRDFRNLMTTLHVVDAELDTGRIVSQTELDLERGTELYALRSVNTQACLEITIGALRSLQDFGRVPQRQQARRGRYYSFMPTSLKAVCVERFSSYTADLR